MTIWFTDDGYPFIDALDLMRFTRKELRYMLAWERPNFQPPAIIYD